MAWTPDQIAAGKTHIQGNSSIFDGLSDDAAAAVMNAETIRGPVPVAALKEYFTKNKKDDRVLLARLDEGRTSPALAISDLCRVVWTNIFDPFAEPVNMDSTTVVGMLTGLKDAGIITDAQLTELSALGENRTSFSNSIAAPRCRGGDIAKMREV